MDFAFKAPPPAWCPHGTRRLLTTGSVFLSGLPHGRSLLQVPGDSVRVQALSLGGAAGLRVPSPAPPAGPEASWAGPAGGRPPLQRPQTRGLSPTNGPLVSALPGLHEPDSADLLRVSEPDQPELRGCDPGAGRGVEVSLEACLLHACMETNVHTVPAKTAFVHVCLKLFLNPFNNSEISKLSLLSWWYRHAVCIFYLVLRALDTVEDDMTIPLDKKVPMLTHFHTYLYQEDWCFTESQEKDRQVLEDFPTVSVSTRTGRLCINVSVTMHHLNPDITGIPKPRSGIQRGHLGYMSPHGSRDGRVSGEEGWIHEGVGPGNIFSVYLGNRISILFFFSFCVFVLQTVSLQTVYFWELTMLYQLLCLFIKSWHTGRILQTIGNLICSRVS